MKKSDIIYELDDLILELHDENECISLLEKIHLHRSITPLDKQLEDSLSYLRCCLKYMLFDNECLRRENRRLYKKLGDQ